MPKPTELAVAVAKVPVDAAATRRMVRVVGVGDRESLLDLLVQLLSTEKIVSGGVHGFHRTGTTNNGGKVLNALDHNRLADRKDVAARIRDLIVEHKTLWIDQIIGTRDELVHPDKGMHQLMFHLEFVQRGEGVLCERVNAPRIGEESIDQYAQRMLQQAGVFSSRLLGLLRGGPWT